MVTFQYSEDGVNWGTAVANGPLTTKITNTTPAGDTTSTFDTEMFSLDISGGGPVGPLMIRESPSKASLGKHTLRSDPRGYRVSSFFDVWLELSTNDGKTWVPAERSVRLLPSLPAPVPGTVFIRRSGNDAVLHWQNEFTLQSTPSLRLPFTDVEGLEGPITTGPYTNTMTGTPMYFRLRN